MGWCWVWVAQGSGYPNMWVLAVAPVAVGRASFWMGWGADKEERGRDFGELLWV